MLSWPRRPADRPAVHQLWERQPGGSRWALPLPAPLGVGAPGDLGSP